MLHPCPVTLEADATMPFRSRALRCAPSDHSSRPEASMTGASPAGAALLGFGILALLIGTNAWAFSTLGQTSYVLWYLKNGSAVALGASFLGLIWDGLAL